MQKLILSLFTIAGLCLPVQGLGEATNQVATNQVPSGVATTNATPRPSDAELQAAARQVWHKLIVIGVVAFVGAVVVAGAALYGAYRKFGVRGAIVVVVIVALSVVALGSLLLIF